MGRKEGPRQKVNAWGELEPTEETEKMLAERGGGGVRKPPGESSQQGN